MIRVFVGFFQAKKSDHPVLSVCRNDIGRNGRGYQIKITISVGCRQTHTAAKRRYELEAYTATAEFFIGVGAAFLFWIEDGDGGRQLCIGQMVIANDKVD